jgi:hypothetical protein
MQQGEGSMSLGEYLVWLAEDAEHLREFLKNPERSMKKKGVPVEDRDLVLNRDLEAIHVKTREQLGGETVAFIVYTGNWPIVHW